MDDYGTTALTADDASEALSGDESPLSSPEIAEGDPDDDGWGPIFLMACSLLLFGLILSFILISVQLVFGDSELDDDDDGRKGDKRATYGGSSGSSGGSGDGGGAKIAEAQQTTRPPTSAVLRPRTTPVQGNLQTPFVAPPSQSQAIKVPRTTPSTVPKITRAPPVKLSTTRLPSKPLPRVPKITQPPPILPTKAPLPPTRAPTTTKIPRPPPKKPIPVPRTTRKPATPKHATPKPKTKKPTTRKPRTKKPTTPKPTTKKPTTPKPTTKKPTTKKPTTKKPTTPMPTTPMPTTPMPTTPMPTTPMPTTPMPTTPTPTTPMPTTPTPTTPKPTTPKPTTPKPTTPKPTTPQPTTPKPTTPKPTTPKPTTPKPTTPKPPTMSTGTTTALGPLIERPPTTSSVICTVDSEGKMEVPADGVCDFIFYDSLGDPFDRLGRPTRGPFKTFQTLAAKGKKTQFGVSIFPLDVGPFLTLLNRQQATAWSKEKLWNHNIYHWGVLSIRKTIMEVPGYFGNATVALAKAADISKPSATKRVVSYTFLGYYGETKVACDEALQHLTTHHIPDVLIVLGHIAFKEQDVEIEVANYECIILPPIIYKVPYSVQSMLVYGHTIMEAARLLTCIARKLKPLPVIGISLTLKGRWYLPKVDDINVQDAGEYSVFKQCESFQEFGVPQLICNQTKTKYPDHLDSDSNGLYSFTYDKSPGRKQTYTFDDATSFKEKVCHVIYNSTLLNYTFMVYDVNYDYAPSLCPQKLPGTYSRLLKIKELLRFLINDSLTKNYDDCRRIY